MNKQEIKDKIANKCYAKVEFLKLEIKGLDKTTPHFAYTQEMIDGLISFKERELELWNRITYLNEVYGGK
jgi:hypothetical protein